jgi:uncharacterized protein (TIGR03437 family)
MLLKWLALGSFCCGVAWAAAPSYSAANIVNAGNYTPGPFAPNSILSIFGTDLAISEHILTASDMAGDMLPTRLDATRVFVDNMLVPLLYVSDTQINFLIPSAQGIGPAVIRVTREGFTGPEVTISIADAAPALFINPNSTGYALVSHRDLLSVVSPDSPAKAGDMVVIWATGLGKTVPNPPTGELPPYIAEITNKANFQVLLDGAPVDPARVLYAGLTPQSAGLYQINVTLPDNVAADPEIRVAIGTQSTPPGLRLAVQ